MAKYRAIRYFIDLQDNNHPYKKGQIYPRRGFKVSEERISELLCENNKQGVPVIEKIEED